MRADETSEGGRGGTQQAQRRRQTFLDKATQRHPSLLVAPRGSSFDNIHNGSNRNATKKEPALWPPPLTPATEQQPEVPILLAYNSWLRGVQTDAEKLVNGLNMAAFRSQFQKQRGSVDLCSFIRIVRRIMESTGVGTSSRRDCGAGSTAGGGGGGRSSSTSAAAGGGNGRRGSDSSATTSAYYFEGLGSEEVTARLMELFREIDVDGDGRILWEEFARFVLAKATQLGQSMGLRPEERERPVIPFIPVRPPYMPDTFTKRKHPYERICVAVLAENGDAPPLLAAVEHDATTVQFYEMKHQHAKSIGCVRTGAKVLAMASVPPSASARNASTLVTSGSDLFLRMWHLNDAMTRSATRWTLKHQWPVAKSQHCLSYAHPHHLLLSGADREILCFSMEDHERRGRFTGGHTGNIFDILALSDLDVVASASSDATVCVWDLHKECVAQRLVGHKKAVANLAFCATQRLLVSGGYDHEPRVWSPFVATQIYKLVGHTAPITAVQSVADRDEIITGDGHGTVKLWDLRTFRCIQSFVADECDLYSDNAPDNHSHNRHHHQHHTGSSNKLTGVSGSIIDALRLSQDSGPPGPVVGIVHVPMSRQVARMVVATKRLHMLEQEWSVASENTDDLPINCVCFNEVCFTVITCAGASIKIWDAILGSIRAVYTNNSRADVSAMCLDDRGRKILVGDVRGKVNVITHQSGALMKTLDTKTDASVTGLIYVGSGKQVLVAFADRSIRVYDEGHIAICPLIRVIDWESDSIDWRDLSSISLFPHLFNGRGPYVAAGCGRTVGLVNYSSGRCEATLSLMRGEDDGDDDDGDEDDDEGEEEEEDDDDARNSNGIPRSLQRRRPFSVLATTFLGDSPLLAISCADGYIQVWSVWPILGSQRGCILRFPNQAPRGYTYDGEEDQLYPLLQQPRRGGANKNAAAALPKEQRQWRTRPRFDSPRAKAPMPAACIVWDAKDNCLYTGDESGRLRAWDLAAVYDCLEENRLLVHTGSWRVAALRSRPGGRSTQEQLQELSEEIEPCLSWSVEAHDDAITCLSLVGEPRAILTGSGDNHVKMWSLEGRPYGKLLQSVPSGEKSKDWDLSGYDVNKRVMREDEALVRLEQQVLMHTTVLDTMTLRDNNNSAAPPPQVIVRSANPAPFRRTFPSNEEEEEDDDDDEDGQHRVLNRLACLDGKNGGQVTRPPRVQTAPSLSEAITNPMAHRQMKRLWFNAAVSRNWQEQMMDGEPWWQLRKVKKKPKNRDDEARGALMRRFFAAKTQVLFSTQAPSPPGTANTMRSDDDGGDSPPPPLAITSIGSLPEGVLTLMRRPSAIPEEQATLGVGGMTAPPTTRPGGPKKPWTTDFIREVFVSPTTTMRCRESIALTKDYMVHDDDHFMTRAATTALTTRGAITSGNRPTKRSSSPSSLSSSAWPRQGSSMTARVVTPPTGARQTKGGRSSSPSALSSSAWPRPGSSVTGRLVQTKGGSSPSALSSSASPRQGSSLMMTATTQRHGAVRTSRTARTVRGGGGVSPSTSSAWASSSSSTTWSRTASPTRLASSSSHHKGPQAGGAAGGRP